MYTPSLCLCLCRAVSFSALVVKTDASLVSLSLSLSKARTRPRNLGWTLLLKTSEARLRAAFGRLDRQRLDAASELVENRAVAPPLFVAKIVHALGLGRQRRHEVVHAHDERLPPRAEDARHVDEAEQRASACPNRSIDLRFVIDT